MNPRRGDIVLASFPFASGAGAKQRPVLIVQNDRDNARLRNTVVAQVTSNTGRAHEPTQVLIELSTPEGMRSGLLTDSVVSCNNLATLGVDRLGRVIGSLPQTMMAVVDECLRAALQL